MHISISNIATVTLMSGNEFKVLEGEPKIEQNGQKVTVTGAGESGGIRVTIDGPNTSMRIGNIRGGMIIGNMSLGQSRSGSFISGQVDGPIIINGVDVTAQVNGAETKAPEKITLQIPSGCDLSIDGVDQLLCTDAVIVCDLDVNGNGQAELALPCATGDVTIDVSGQTRVTMQSAEAKKIIVHASGMCQIELAGTSDKLKINASGMVQVDHRRLLVNEEPQIKTSGMAQVKS